MPFARGLCLFLTTAGAVALLLYACPSVYGQSTMTFLPFVGCPSFGQTEELEAPKGTSEPVPIKEPEAHALAYYKSADGISVLAPRGWYCQGISGSGGAALFVEPRPIIRSRDVREDLDGAAIEVDDISGENSGRYEIEEFIARVFPKYRSFVHRIWGFDPEPDYRPYPKDTLTYRSDTVVEFRTPPQTEGLGNSHSWLGKNDLPIAGAAILLIDSSHPARRTPHLVHLSVRFLPDSEGLAPAIIRYVEHEAVVAYRK